MLDPIICQVPVEKKKVRKHGFFLPTYRKGNLPSKNQPNTSILMLIYPCKSGNSQPTMLIKVVETSTVEHKFQYSKRHILIRQLGAEQAETLFMNLTEACDIFRSFCKKIWNHVL
jgi:hypothetical protein